MTTFYKDLNYELTQHNQRMRMEICSYRNEIIKVREDLMKQREENALLKSNLTSEFLKVSKSFNIIFNLLQNTCNDSLDDTLTTLNNSIKELNKNYGDSIPVDPATNEKRVNIGRISVIAENSYNADDTSVSNFSFDVETDEAAPTVEVGINTSEAETDRNAAVFNKDQETSFVDESALSMSVIEEEADDLSSYNNTIIESTATIDETILPLTSPQFRSTIIGKRSPTLSLNNIPIRDCSVVIRPIKIESSFVQSTIKAELPVNVIPQEQLNNSRKQLKSLKQENFIDNKIAQNATKLFKPSDRRLPRRQAAPTVLTEQSIKGKLRRA